VPAVATKLPVVAPAGTVTDAGVVSAVLLSDNVTAVPPVGAACEMVTVHVELPPDRIEDGVQVMLETVGSISWPTVIVPPVPVAPVETPPVETAIVLLIGSETNALLVGLNVKETVATRPLGMVLVLIPEVRQVKVPDPAAQFSVLPAPLSAAPAIALIEVTSLGE
jgi:hypothetical protein